MSLLREILSERPNFHCGETEVQRSFNPQESCLPESQSHKLAAMQPACYGIDADLANFIDNAIDAKSYTLETGSGISTLIFALNETTHTSVSPNKQESEAIRKYAKGKGINLDKISFVIDSSDHYLPQSTLSGLDLVFLDGKHAFPWPIVDWFYTVDKLKKGGLIVIDDAHMKSVGILVDFMSVDPAWKLIKNFDGKTVAFEKIRESVHDVAWHMQPYTMSQRPNFIKRVIKKGLRKLSSLGSV